MSTECSAESFDFGTMEGRCVEAAFDARLVTSDTGALLLGARSWASAVDFSLWKASTMARRDEPLAVSGRRAPIAQR